MTKKLNSFFILLIVLCTILSLKAQTKKLALVIGNGDYQGAALKNPPNDAKKFAELLENIGFEVTKAIDVNREEYENQIRVFSYKIQPNDIILFYFSGHGAQVNGINYLIPIDENIFSEDEIRYKAISIDFILDKFEKAKSGLIIILLDACRTNPFKGFRTTNQGLAFVNSSFGTLISYATSPGNVAYDGIGENSPYMEGLLEVLPAFSLKIEEVFKQVRKRVMEKTKNKQIPWESSSLVGDFYFTKQPLIAKVYKPEFILPPIVKGYTQGILNAYIDTKCPQTEIKRDKFIEIEYELIDNNIIAKISPIIVKILKRKSPTEIIQIWDEQFESNHGKNIIRFSADYDIGEYEVEYGFYFRDNFNIEYPTFYMKKCPLKIVE